MLNARVPQRVRADIRSYDHPSYADEDAPHAELTTFQCREAYVYKIPPASTIGHRAELWDVDHWLQVEASCTSPQHATLLIPFTSPAHLHMHALNKRLGCWGAGGVGGGGDVR